MRVVLETDRLALREMEPSDLDVVAAMLADREVMRHWPRPYTRDEAIDWIARQRARYARDGHGYRLAVDRGTGRVVGQAGVMTIEVNRRPELALGYILRREHWGEGYATEAAAAVRDHGFATTTHDRIVALVRPVNLPSQGVARRLGMRPAGLTTYSGLAHVIFALDRPVPVRGPDAGP
ncbi:MAG TPA: GNAT family N-acetyltransferase [Patescibacteria group bacterium]|nr:GNAT family N-acetyltransferase [Patescibacteria group bacterium]